MLSEKEKTNKPIADKVIKEANERFPGEENRVLRNVFVKHRVEQEKHVRYESVQSGDGATFSNFFCFNDICFNPHEIDGRNYLVEKDLIDYLNRIFNSADQIEKKLDRLMELIYMEKNAEQFLGVINEFLRQKGLVFTTRACNSEGICKKIELGKKESNYFFPGANAADFTLAINDGSIPTFADNFGTLRRNENDMVGTVALAAVGAYLFFPVVKKIIGGVSSVVKTALGYEEESSNPNLSNSH